ncbi:hypothetical protein COCNU_scaffold000938G000010 [Cocos nucifera]|nr:hypothetical protein [Cocos nucifera]
MTPKEQTHLARGIKFLKRKGGSFGEPLKKADIGESSQAVPVLGIAVVASSPAVFEEVAPSAPLQQEEVVERKKRKAIEKKVGRKAGNSRGKGPSQKQASLNDRKVVHSLMVGSILSHIIKKMFWKDNVERFDESFAAYHKVIDSFRS